MLVWPGQTHDERLPVTIRKKKTMDGATNLWSKKKTERARRGEKKQRQSSDKHAKQHLGSLSGNYSETKRQTETVALLLGSFLNRNAGHLSFLQPRR